MNVKSWLSRANKIDQQITSKYEQIEMWRNLAAKMSSNLVSEHVNGGNNEGRLEIYCIKIADAEADIKRQLNELVTIKKEISDVVNSLEDYSHRILLEQRYLLCKSWEDIANFMGYSIRYITYRLHTEALEYVRLHIKSKLDP